MQKPCRSRETRKKLQAAGVRHDRRQFLAALASAPIALAWRPGSAFATAPPSKGLLVTNARIVDGTGAARYLGSVRVAGERIAAVGELQPLQGESVLDARGLALAPGFIDTHNHHVDSFGVDDNYLPKLPEALAAVSQGITTSVVGVDGRSGLPMAGALSQLEKVRPAINVASFVGHGSLRLHVMGDDFRRPASACEIEVMRSLLARAMDEGALGLSTGLEYNPGVYSTREEVVTLAAESARQGGRYMSHIRSEDRELWSALEEVIEIGRSTGGPVHLSHMKLGMKDLWGQVQRFIDVLDGARQQGIDVTGDVYPYDFWQTTLTALFPDRDYSVTNARYALDHVVDAAGIRFTHYEPDRSLVGRTLAEIAASRGEDPAVTLTSLIVDVATPEEFELATMAGMHMSDVDRLLLWPHSNVCSDGALVDGHPRGRGAFTRILRDYVRERRLMSLEQAIHKMTGLAASHMGIADRGRVQPGFQADLVLFDPDTVADRATALDPLALSVGIDTVWVNGVETYRAGQVTGARPGKVLRGPAFKRAVPGQAI